MKEQDITMYLARRIKVKTSETSNCQNGNEASISRLITSVEQTTRKGHTHM